MPGFYEAGTIEATATIDKASFDATLASMQADALAFASKAYTVPFNAELNQASASKVEAEIAAMGDLFSNQQLDLFPVVDMAAMSKTEAELRALTAPRVVPVIPAVLGLGGAGDGAGGAGGGVLAAGGAAAAAGGIWTFIHAAHLFTPEIIGVITAVSAVVIGFAALGIASIGAATDIMTGFQAVSSAQNAIQAAIPGTTQWATGITNLGLAWSAIPTALQPAVSAINNMMAGFGKSPMSKEIQGFLGAQAGSLSHLFGGGGGTFAPLIYAAQQAMVTVEGIFSKSLGGGALSSFVDSIARMVGPASVELTQIVIAVLQIAGAFAKAVQDGQGMEVIVNLFQTLASVVSSPLFSAFVAGWVDFDRVLSVGIGLLIKGVGFFATLSGEAQGLGLVLGFVASGLLAVKAATFLAGKMGLQGAADFTIFGSSMNSILGKAAGVGLIAVGITGLAQNVATLLHTSNPLTTVWNAIGKAFGFVSHAADGSISTINGYKLQLSGAIPITGQLSNAMDLLVRSEQAIGSSLVSAATGFATFTVAATDSVATIINNLIAQNGSLATWAADAQILIKRGMDPSAVASLAQQAPQDLASMVTATTAQLQTMNVQWAEKMMEAKMSGQNGVNAMITAIKSGLTSGSPVLTAAAKALATTLGTALGTPFTGAVASVKSIGAALNALPVSVLQDLAGKTHLYSVAANDAATKTKATHTALSGMLGTVLSMASNVAILALGVKLLGAWTVITTIATKAWAGAQWLLNAAMDANPIVLIVLAIIGLIAAGVLLITHWKQVTAIARTVWTDVSGFFANLWHDVTSDVGHLASDVVSFFQKLPGRIIGALGNVGTMLFNVGKAIVQGLIHGIESMVGGIEKTLGNIVHTIQQIPVIGKLFGSPSPYYIGVGQAIGQGLAIGIDSSSGLAVGATTRLVSKVAGAGYGMISTAGMTGTSAASAGGWAEVANEVRALRAEIRALPRGYKLAARTA